jgi:hypothetical protein
LIALRGATSCDTKDQWLLRPVVRRLYRAAAFLSRLLGGGGEARSARNRLLSRAESLITVGKIAFAAVAGADFERFDFIVVARSYRAASV